MTTSSSSSIAMGFVGGKSGERLEQALRSLGIETDFNWIEGETRTNVSIVKADNSQYLKVNEAGPTIAQGDIDALTEKVRVNAKPGDWWVLAGSLPPGVPATIYASLINIIEGAGAKVMLDTSGETLRTGCEAKPTIIKPNMEEARELAASICGKGASDADIAKAVLAMGPKNMIISMGKEGALLATQDDLQMVKTPAVKERNPIGAGDSMVGGIIWGESGAASYRSTAEWYRLWRSDRQQRWHRVGFLRDGGRAVDSDATMRNGRGSGLTPNS